MAPPASVTDVTDKLAQSFEETALAPDSIELPVPTILKGKSDEELKIIRSKATRKLDLYIMPAMIIIYIFNYLDRQNVAAARLDSLERDLGLSAVQYQTVISILFVGYILMQVPSNMIVAKISRPGLYICASMAGWGVVSAATGAVHNFAGLVSARFFLGMVEAVFFPGAFFFLSCFYTKKQFATRISILYTGSQLGNAFGGLLAIGILEMRGLAGLAGWRWLFIVEGAATVLLALLFALVLPNKVASMKALTEEERAYVAWDLEREQGAADDGGEISSGRAFILAVTDPKTWLLCGLLYCTYIAAAVVSFFPSVVINGWHSDKVGERFWHIAIPLAFAVLANAVAISTLNTGARYFAMMMFPTSLYGAAVIILSWIAGSITQPSPKRAVAMSLINALCNTPNIWTTYLYKAPPRYLNAFSLNLAASALAILFAVATRIYLKKKNDELDRGDRSARGAPTEHQLALGFRYTL